MLGVSSDFFKGILNFVGWVKINITDNGLIISTVSKTTDFSKKG